MKNFTSVASTICITAMLLAGCGTAEPSKEGSAATETAKKEVVLMDASFPTYNNIDELANQADLIIEGKILKSSFKLINIAEEPADPNDEKLNPGGDISDSPAIPYTIYDVEVQKNYKGKAAEKEIIQVKQVGGEDQKHTFKVEDSEELKTNENYVMFLATFENSPASLLNPVQGSYTVEDDGTIKGNEKNHIKIEMNNLLKLEQ